MVSPGRKLQCISYQHIKFILYLYELKHILLKRMYFREDLPESLNWLAKDIVVFKFCAFLQLSKNVSLKSFFTIRIIHCYIQYFILFYFFSLCGPSRVNFPPDCQEFIIFQCILLIFFLMVLPWESGRTSFI